MKPREVFERAKEFIFDETGMGDVSAQLGTTVTQYGLAKIHWVQQQLGLEPNAFFVATPDQCPAKNVEANQAGFGYGGRLVWGDGTVELVILDVYPNYCGVLIGGLAEPIDVTEMAQIIMEAAENHGLVLDGLPFTWNVGVRNHFLRMDQVVSPDARDELPEWVFTMHCSAEDLKEDTHLGPGTYFTRSSWLQQNAQRFDTPWGPLHILTDSKARKYWEFAQLASVFSCRRRELMAERLFGDALSMVVSNRIHQGLDTMNSMRLGVQVMDGTDAPYAVMLKPTLPIALMTDSGLGPTYQVNARNPEIAAAARRAQELSLLEQIQQVQIIPHGGGYILEADSVGPTLETTQGRVFTICRNGSMVIFPNIRNEAYTYRGWEVVDRIERLGQAYVIARMLPVWSVKVE